MKLTKTERWILFNQFQILEKLGGTDYSPVETCKRTAEALSCGYELDYAYLSPHIYDGDDVLPADECREVLEILGMYDALQFSHQQLGSKSLVSEHDVKFPGFDGNNEGSQLSYAHFIIKDHRFESLISLNKDLNSHMPTLELYRRMLAMWKPLQLKPLPLSPAEAKAIIDVKHRD